MSSYLSPLVLLAVMASLLLMAAVIAIPDTMAPPAPVPVGVSDREALPAKRIAVGDIHNAFKLTPWLYSGSVPETDADFAHLQQLGIQTIVSVDGARPNIEQARAHGMRYVHIPMRYSGITAGEAAALTRVVRECSAPVYVHCHHGKHRGPAAAAVCAVASGEYFSRQALEFLEQAGTGKNYAGLWRDVSAFQPLGEGAALPELVEQAPVGTLVESMVRIDELAAELEQVLAQEQGFAGDAHELLVNQSLLLAEEFTEAGRQVELECRENRSDTELARLRDGLKQSARLAIEFHEALQRSHWAQANAQLHEIKESCTACHARHRDR